MRMMIMVNLLDLKNDAYKIALSIFKDEIVLLRYQLSQEDRAHLDSICSLGMNTTDVGLQNYYDLIERSLRYE